MKGNKMMKVGRSKIVKLTALLAGSLCLLGLLAGCGQAKSTQASEEASAKTITQSQGQTQKTTNSAPQESASPANTNQNSAAQTSSTSNASPTAPSTPAAAQPDSGNSSADGTALNASEIQKAQQVRTYMENWVSEVQNNSGAYGYDAWNNGALFPKVVINTFSNAQLWSAYEQSENNCVTRQLNIPNCGISGASYYLDTTSSGSPITMSLAQVKSILKLEIPWAHITNITYTVFPSNNFPCYFVYTTQSLASDQPFWYVNPETGYAINIYGEAADQPQTPVTEQNYIPALMRLYAVFGQSNWNYTWGSAWVDNLSNSTLLTDFLQANPSYQVSNGNVITNSMINTAIQRMTQNAWAGPATPYSMPEASKLIRQETWFWTFDDSIGPQTISKIVQHGSLYYVYFKGNSSPVAGINAQTGFIGNA